MSRYRKIEVRTWADERFRRLSPIQPSGQGLWFFLLTGPHTGPIPGLFRAGRAAMAEELDWDVEAFDEAFQEVFENGMAKADFKARLVWLPNALKHNKPESPNVVRSWRVELDILPECDLKNEAISRIREILESIGPSYVQAFDEVLCGDTRKPSSKPSGKPSSKSIPNQEQEQEQEQEQKITNPDGLVVASTADDEQIEPNLKKSTTPNCPQQALLDLYAECLPELPQPRVWEGQAADNLRSRWRWVLTATKRGSCERYASTADEGVEWFRRFFGYVAGSDFLMGRKADWQADLRWLVKAANFDKVLSGAYENGRAAA